MKAVLAALTLVSATVVSRMAAQDDDDARKSLAGLNGVLVQVQESFRDEAQREGVDTIQLRTIVELKLRQAGIPVLTKRGRANLSVLVIGVNTLELYAFSISVEVVQGVRLMRNPAVSTSGATWSHTFIGMAGRDNFPSYFRERVGDAMDRFINAYLAANPKR